MSICVVFSKVFYIRVSLCAFVMYACEDTLTLKFGGVMFPNPYVYICMHVFMIVWCEALLSNIFVWIWKPNEDKMSVIQYLWECQVEIAIDESEILSWHLDFGWIVWDC